MTTIYPKLIHDALATVRYPGNGKTIVENGMVEDDIRIEGNKVSFSLLFERETDPFIKSIVKAAESAILNHVGKDVEIAGNINVKYKQEPKPAVKNQTEQVKHIIAVSSGKGGVGKSTVSLAKLGFKVGLFDADIFGPSAPKMFGIEDARPYLVQVEGRDLIEPIEKYGVKVLSIGFFVDSDKALLWRGAMATSAIKQLINEGNWGELDYLLVDLPPGTGDVPLTVFQSIPLDGIVIVTSPQSLVTMIVKKAYNMATAMNIPVLGIVENYSYVVCPDCGKKISVFGESHVDEMAAKYGLEVLEKLPLDPSIAKAVDEGLIELYDSHMLDATAEKLEKEFVLNEA